MIRGILLAVSLWLSIGAAQAQENQCRTVPAGTSTSYCASEATVAESRGSLPSGPFASLAACSSTTEGQTADVTDSTTNVFGATITGSGTFHVLAYCNGTNWTVAGGGASPSGGTVSNVGTAGLATGGPITGSGTVTVTAAIKSDQTTATSNSVAVTPGVQQFHPSAAKAWVNFTGSGSNGAQTINASFNVTSVVRTSQGAYTINFTVAFTSIRYVCMGAAYSAGTTNGFVQFATPSVGSIPSDFINISGPAGFDPTNGGVIACFGTE